MHSTITAFCSQQRQWLDAELQSEDAESPLSNAAKPKSKNHQPSSASSTQEGQRSSVLTNLQVDEVSVGLYGRTVVVLARAAAAQTSSSESSLSSDSKQKKKSLLSNQQILLPAHRFTTGDEVEIRTKSSSAKQNEQGVVSQVTEFSISIALFGKRNNNQNKAAPQDEVDANNSNDILSEEHTGLLMLVPSRSIEVHKKYKAALNQLEKHGVDHPVAGAVVRSLFDSSCCSSSTSPQAKDETFQAFNDRLDESQIEAIQFALSDARPCVLIHGPPGTGKTTTLVELIRQAVHVHNKKVLVAAPSNVAVDNLLARLVSEEQRNSSSVTSGGGKSSKQKRSNNNHNSKTKTRVVRLGHPARLQADILPYSLEALVQTSEGTEIVRQVRTEMQSFLQVLANPKSRGNEKRVAYREMKSLRQEVRQREEKVVRELLTSAQVVLATCVGSANSILSKALGGNDDNNNNGFDLVVIDEAAQALEAACWIPALQGKRLVLAGDHHQLPPTIQSNQHEVARGLGTTMFERMMDLYGEEDNNSNKGQISRMLQVQYRMHQSISDWASQALYRGQLRTHESVAARTIEQLVGTAEENNNNIMTDSTDLGPFLLIDTAGCSMFEGVNGAGSRFNEAEASIVSMHVRRLVKCGVTPEQIAVISPYNGQVELLKASLLGDFPKLEIRSVDGFQGGERESVVLSLVRSSERSGIDGIGFLRDDRRLNVAVTRAKRHCCVVCDSETVSQSKFVKNLLDWMEEHGETRSALEFDNEKTGNDDQMQSDIAAAEMELNRIMKQSNKPSSTQVSPDEKKTSNSSQQKTGSAELIDRVKEFAKCARPGEELIFHNQLSRGERRSIHEIAEQLGLEHQSQGIEGVDRHLIIKKLPTEEPAEASSGADEAVAVTEEGSDFSETEVPATAHAFAVLSVEDGNESICGSDENNAEKNGGVETLPSMNNVLGDLARERAERAQQNNQQQTGSASVANTSAPNKKTKKKGKKLGGKQKKPQKEPQALGEEDDMDDMEYLNAQIEKVQTSHGRKIEGTGKNYKTIVNGILVAKAEPTPKKKDAASSSALQAKIKQKQNDRKVKKKK